MNYIRRIRISGFITRALAIAMAAFLSVFWFYYPKIEFLIAIPTLLVYTVVEYHGSNRLIKRQEQEKQQEQDSSNATI